MNRTTSILILAIILMAVFSACASNTGNANSTAPGNTNAAAANTNAAVETGAYPAEVAEEFIASCEEAGGTAEFCGCVFDKVKQAYTFEEFSAIEAKIAEGEPPADFVEFSGNARTECTK